jgi:hypothetical protein
MVLWDAFYRASEGAERPGCEGEWWPSVGELKYMVMARGGMGGASFGSGGAWRRLAPMEEATVGRAAQRRWPNGRRRCGHQEDKDDCLVGLCGPHD